MGVRYSSLGRRARNRLTIGDRLRLEGESLVLLSASAPAAPQNMTSFGSGWSGGQLWFRADSPGDAVTVKLNVPRTGTYTLTAAYTRAPDYGQHVLSIDGTIIGGTFNGYVVGEVIPSGPVSYGDVHLDAGTHTLRLQVMGKTPASRGYFAGLDYVELHLLNSQA